MKESLYDLSREALAHTLEEWGEPTYRSRQIWEWLYRHLASDPAEMENLPLALRKRLSEEFEIGGLETVTIELSEDGETEKRLFRLADGETIETVLMRYRRRNTLCISSQVGCAMGCVFCATGQMGFRRNLRVGEILSQVLTYERELRRSGERVSNVVLMGMGEPLANYDAVLAAVRRMTDPQGLKLGGRRITISTIGLVPAIRRLAGEGLPLGLAISLHAATDAERRQLVPAAQRWPLAELVAAGKEYAEHTGRRVTYEWALIKGENDTAEQAHALGKLISGTLCHVNLIPLNPTPAYSGERSEPGQLGAFQKVLNAYGIPNTVRLRRGIDIQAGCGQLKQRSA
jgi:23S rRNA (adenine2503-C2)-methyltransferase